MSYIGETSPLFQANETYVAELYARYQEDPKSVEPDWASFFENMSDEELEFVTHDTGPSWASNQTKVIGGQTGSAGLSDSIADEKQYARVSGG